MNDVVDWLLQTVQQVDPVLRTLLAALGMLCETSILVGLVVPGDSIVLIAGTAVTSWLEWAALIVAVVAGSLVGESIGFALGWRFGPAIRRSRLGRRIGEQHWVRAETYLARRGGVAVLLSRFLPVLHSLIPLTVGASGMPYRRFIRWTAPACVVWALLYVSVSAGAATSYRELSDRLHLAGWFVAGGVVVIAAAVIVARRILHRREQRHMSEDAAAQSSD